MGGKETNLTKKKKKKKKEEERSKSKQKCIFFAIQRLMYKYGSLILARQTTGAKNLASKIGNNKTHILSSSCRFPM